MRIKSRWVKLFSILFIFFAVPTLAQAKLPWNQWVAQLRQEALSQGINPQLFDQVFKNLQPDKRTINYDRSQPETRLTYLKYRNTRGDSYRINLGKKKYKRYGALLNEIGHSYGVDPCVITSLWGIESSYGHYMGKFSVIKSLATLAYDNRRSEFFRRELLLALQILNKGDITPEKFVGEWAGGTGQPQFLPSSWFEYAVDYDGDGHRDIWTNKADVFASIANYLKKNGWQEGIPWYVEVEVPPRHKNKKDGHSYSVREWSHMGIRTINGYHMPNDSAIQARLIKPYGGPYFLVFDNFDVIKRYNNSTFYAGTVGYIADKICQRL